MIIKFILFAIILIAGEGQAHETFTGRVVHVSDGDTLWVQSDLGGPSRKLRLDGIDAPEICQPAGEASRAALLQMTWHKWVVVTVRQYDDYGRGLAHIRLNDGDVGAQLVRAGHAWSYRWRRSLGPYAEEEAVARQSGIGLFASEQPELPRDFRRRHGSCNAVRHERKPPTSMQ